MNIVTTASKVYVKPLVVMLTSLFENNKNRCINVYVLNTGYEKEEKEWIYSTLTNKKHRIILLKVDTNEFEGLLNTGSHYISVYFRLLAIKYLPKGITKYLSLGADTVINNNLDELYNIEFDDKLLVACSINSEEEILKRVHEGKQDPEDGGCFNADVVLYNLKRIREIYSLQNFIETIKSVEFSLDDQGILNYMFWDKTKYIDTKKYNNRGYDGISYDDIIIIHYSGLKPWEVYLSDDEINQFMNIKILNWLKGGSLNSFYMGMADIWWKYAKKTRIYMLLLEEKNIKTNFFMNTVRYEFLHTDKLMGRISGMALLAETTLKYGSISDCFYKKGINRCGLYGMGKAGQYVLKDLKEHDFEVVFYSDRKMYPEINVEYKKIEELKDIDIVLILCVMYDCEKIKNKLQKSINGNVILLSELLQK